MQAVVSGDDFTSASCYLTDTHSDLSSESNNNKRPRRSRDKCRYCRKYKAADEAFEEHMLKCPGRPDLKDRKCKYCSEHIPEGTTFTKHNEHCTRNKLRAVCKVCHKSELKEDVNEHGQCKRCIEIIERIHSRQTTPESTPSRKFGIVKKARA